MIDLTDVQIFKDLTYIETEEAGFDIHNDYSCIQTSFDATDNTLKFSFQSSKDSILKYRLELIFQNIKIEKFDLLWERNEDSGTLNNFYRGKFEIQNSLVEFLDTGERFFYIEFEMGDKFEISAKKAFFSFQAIVEK
ncbi:MAG: hypothetical protein QM802_04850 [Agriterribacter sp.]